MLTVSGTARRSRPRWGAMVVASGTRRPTVVVCGRGGCLVVHDALSGELLQRDGDEALVAAFAADKAIVDESSARAAVAEVTAE